ncbi:MAG TPA: extracellular solute-binding protein [Candidatus Limnocylindrales bacterium]|jgi:spermidine/putrescine transport system substrate-binding protein
MRSQISHRPKALIASLLVTVSLVGCGISGQSQAPGASTPSVATPPPAAQTPGSQASTGVAQSQNPPSSGGGGPLNTANPSSIPSIATGPATPEPTVAGSVSWANWPVYIDIADDGSYPTIDKFTSETGIQVQYHEDINDNSEFFGKIQPDLQAGRPTGYDMITPSDWMVAKLIRFGYLQPLDKSLLPNWTANAQDVLKNPWYDPGNIYSVPWQAGIVGIAYNPKLTGRDITSFDDLLDPAFAGRSGLFSEMIDTMSLTLLSDGVHPEDATMDDVVAAQQKLLAAAQSGQFRAFYGNDYYDALANGDLAVSMAWSGDISQMQLYDNPDVKFVIPSTGGMLFVDNMVIPNYSQHPADAYKLMDYWYTLEAAVPLTEYIGYFSPVKGVQEAVTADAQTAAADGKPIKAAHLTQIANDSFPTPEELQNVYNYKNLSEDEERQWNDLFNQVVNG